MADTQAQLIARLLAQAAAQDLAIAEKEAQIQALAAKVAAKPGRTPKDFAPKIGAKGGVSIEGVGGSTQWLEVAVLKGILDHADELSDWLDAHGAQAQAARDAHKLTPGFLAEQAERAAKRKAEAAARRS